MLLDQGADVNAQGSEYGNGLDFNNLSIKGSLDATDNSTSKEASTPTVEPKSQPSGLQSPSSEQPPTEASSPTQPSGEAKERKKPYVNPERVKTGGDKLSDEELAERIKRIRQQNEKIKQRLLDVQADEDAFRKTQEVDRAKQTRSHKVQESVDNAHEQNAKRKMDKIQSREWDSGKPAPDWKNKGQASNSKQTTENVEKEEEGAEGKEVSQNQPEGQWTRGGGVRGSYRGRGHGRGRGRGTGPTPKAETTGKALSPESKAEGTKETVAANVEATSS
ncbi:hypothetical protein K435DRAFT_777354 [Dendrothele bispora CBS 962.96]|uniref:Uncharacterized protein n=1 Tax=Dendrothele bispora (strain CBS 962.96) TaxID=1314807 RepID=A0A4S8M8J8_DENBC|nr:hypothetical protein K435DRAFT_777354 [Dendrothele bispora CBS 962.96]